MQNSTSQSPKNRDLDAQCPTRVLIVEDESLVALDTQRRLESLGLDVLGVVKTGLSALAIIEHEPIDLVMMDVHLRGEMDGAQTALQLRERYDIPCVFLTAYGDDETIERCRPASPLGYIVKPYDSRAFALTITLAQQQLKLMKEREAAVRDRDMANARYAHMLLHSVDAVLSFNADLTISDFNRGAEKAFGWTAEEAIGQSLNILIPDRLRSGHDNLLQLFTGSGDTHVSPGSRRRIIALRKDGEEIPAELLVSRSSMGGDLQYTAMIRDLSEEEHLRSQFIQAQKMEAVGLLGAHVAHDFNNLLLGLRAYMYLLRKDAKPSQVSYLDECDRALNRGAGLTHNLTTLARPNSVDERVFDVSTAIEETLRFATELLPRRISFDYQGAPTDCFIRMNRGRFDQALLNLMINARDAISGQGTITVRAVAEVKSGEQWLGIVISDAGSGMSPLVASQAFKPFYTTKPQGLGTGLGLPSVRGIVESAGGSIELSSEQGVGTIISISLPRAHPPSEMTIEESAELSNPALLAQD